MQFEDVKINSFYKSIGLVDNIYFFYKKEKKQVLKSTLDILHRHMVKLLK